MELLLWKGSKSENQANKLVQINKISVQGPRGYNIVLYESRILCLTRKIFSLRIARSVYLLQVQVFYWQFFFFFCKMYTGYTERREKRYVDWSVTLLLTFCVVFSSKLKSILALKSWKLLHRWEDCRLHCSCWEFKKSSYNSDQSSPKLLFESN